MVRQGKPSPTKMGRKNLRVCQPEVNRPVDKEILIWQTIKVCDKSLLGYFRVIPEFGSGEVVGCEKAYYKYLQQTLALWSWGS